MEGVGAAAAATRADRRVLRPDAVGLPVVEDRATAGVSICAGVGIADESLSFCFFFAGPDAFEEPETVRRAGVAAPLGRIDTGAGVVARPTTDAARGRCAALLGPIVDGQMDRDKPFGSPVVPPRHTGCPPTTEGRARC